MKRINTSQIAAGVAYKPTKKGLDFLQDSYKELFDQLGLLLLGYPAVSGQCIIWGFAKTAHGGNWDYSQGAIFDGTTGEIYLHPAQINVAIPNVDNIILQIDNDPVADPSTFTDGTPRNVHNIRRVIIQNSATALAANQTTLYAYSTLQPNILNFIFNTVIPTHTSQITALQTAVAALQVLETWTNGSLLNGWVAMAAEEVPRSRKDRTKVTLSGQLDGNTQTNVIAFVLPLDHMPITTKAFSVVSGNTTPLVSLATSHHGLVTIDTSGNVRAFLNGGDRYLSLNDVEYYVD